MCAYVDRSVGWISYCTWSQHTNLFCHEVQCLRGVELDDLQQTWEFETSFLWVHLQGFQHAIHYMNRQCQEVWKLTLCDKTEHIYIYIHNITSAINLTWHPIFFLSVFWNFPLYLIASWKVPLLELQSPSKLVLLMCFMEKNMDTVTNCDVFMCFECSNNILTTFSNICIATKSKEKWLGVSDILII